MSLVNDSCSEPWHWGQSHSPDFLNLSWFSIRESALNGSWDPWENPITTTHIGTVNLLLDFQQYLKVIVQGKSTL